MRSIYWKWANQIWLDPIAPDADNLHRVPPRFRGENTFTAWYGARWRDDSQSILLFMEGALMTSDVQAIDRQTEEMPRFRRGYYC